MELVRDLINERGGIAGKQLTWVVGDAPDATAAANEATRLISQEGVKLIAGTLSSSLCVPASEVAARNNIIYWEVSCVDPRFSTRGYKNTFRTEIDANGFGWYNIEFTRAVSEKLGIDLKNMKVAFVSEDSAYGQGTTEAGKKRAQELGMTVLSVDYYNRNSMTDFTPVILKLKSSKPDVIVASCYTNDAILLWKQAKQLSLEVKAIISAGSVSLSPDFGRAWARTPKACSRGRARGLNPKPYPRNGRVERRSPNASGTTRGMRRPRSWCRRDLGLAEVLKKTG